MCSQEARAGLGLAEETACTLAGDVVRGVLRDSYIRSGGCGGDLPSLQPHPGGQDEVAFLPPLSVIPCFSGRRSREEEELPAEMSAEEQPLLDEIEAQQQQPTQEVAAAEQEEDTCIHTEEQLLLDEIAAQQQQLIQEVAEEQNEFIQEIAAQQTLNPKP